MRSFVAALALAGGASLASASSDEWEWAGIFDTSGKGLEYTAANDLSSVYWVAQKVDGEYADPTMTIMFIDAGGATSESKLESYKDTANTLLAADDCTTWIGTTALTPTSSICYKLQFDTSAFESIFEIDVDGVDSLAIFAQHYPTEFERSTHYLISDMGDDVEPVHELPESEQSKPYGMVFLTCLMVNICTFAGICFFACGAYKAKDVSYKMQTGLMGFACGALLSCAFFLILPEALYLVGEDESYEEVDTVWRWGTCVLAGFAVPIAFTILEPHKMYECCGKYAPEFSSSAPAKAPKAPESELVASGGTADVSEVEAPVESGDIVVAKKDISASTLIAVISGDFFHNVADGFFIGIAFKACDSSLAWGITGATIYHEFVQEMADYLVLTSEEVGLSPFMAMLYNFISGTSVIIGGMMAVGIDAENPSLGMILAFGGGTYVYLACCECIPEAVKIAKRDMAENKLESLQMHYVNIFGGFFVGCLGIGLILLNHEHCSADGGAHAH